MNADITNLLTLFPAIFIFAIIYYLIPQKFRWTLLLIASYGFITWIGSWSVILVFAISILNFLIGIWIDRQKKLIKFILPFGILINIAFLGFFKYFTGALNLDAYFSKIFSASDLAIIIPIGLSYYTLQNISYLVDVSKGIAAVEKNPGIFLVYNAFFPKIIAGPIERGKTFFNLIRQPENLSWSNISTGTSRILFGLFKKVVIADHMVPFVNEVFDKPGTYQGVTLIIGILFLGFQIYLDFSGYTDIAIGIARILGITLTENFNRPYLSQNLVEFWTRWHISLSTWLRDYIFYPSRRFFLKRIKSVSFLAVLIPPILTMLVSGLWHGTGITFIIWGLFHALFYTIVIVKRNILGNNPAKASNFITILNIIVNFGVVSVGWVFFRADSLTSALTIIRNIFVKSTTLELIMRQTMYVDYLISLVAILLFITTEIILEVFKERLAFKNLPIIIRWTIYLFMILCITILGVYQKGSNIFDYGKF